jgi:voltage-gated potassium channel
VTGVQTCALPIFNPTITDFLDLTLADDRHVPVLMEELLVGSDSRLAGLALKDSGLRADLNLIVVAIKRPDGSMHFNPGPQDVIETGATLMVIGPADRLDRLARLLDSPGRPGINRANHNQD